MSENHSKYEYLYSSSLGSKLSKAIPIYQELAGSEPTTSLAIAVLRVLQKFGKLRISKEKLEFMLAMLNAQRQALFATAEKTNEISKMAMQLPSNEEDIDLAEPSPSEPDTPRP